MKQGAAAGRLLSHYQTCRMAPGGVGASPNACQKYLYLATELPLFQANPRFGY